MGDISGQLPTLFFEGGTPLIEANLPEVTGIIGTWTGFDIAGDLTSALFAGEFGFETFVAGELPLMTAQMVGGGELAGDLPTPEMSATALMEIWGDLSGKLPLSTMAVLAGGEMTGKIGISTFNGYLADQYGGAAGQIVGKLPALQADTSTVIKTDVGSITGKVSVLQFAGTSIGEWPGTLSSYLPPLTGSIRFEEGTIGTINKKLPALHFAGRLDADPNMDLAGTLPQLNMLSVSSIDLAAAAVSYAYDSEDIIRYRREYDNG